MESEYEEDKRDPAQKKSKKDKKSSKKSNKKSKKSKKSKRESDREYDSQDHIEEQKSEIDLDQIHLDDRKSKKFTGMMD